MARNYTADNLYRGDRSLCEWDGYSIHQYPQGTGACGVQGCTGRVNLNQESLEEKSKLSERDMGLQYTILEEYSSIS